MAQHPYPSVRAFIDDVGRGPFEQAVGVKTQLVTRALSDNLFPSGWFITIRDWCEDIGKPVPENLFRWSRPIVTPPGKHSAKQPAGASPSAQASAPAKPGSQDSQRGAA